MDDDDYLEQTRIVTSTKDLSTQNQGIKSKQKPNMYNPVEKNKANPATIVQQSGPSNFSAKPQVSMLPSGQAGGSQGFSILNQGNPPKMQDIQAKPINSSQVNLAGSNHPVIQNLKPNQFSGNQGIPQPFPNIGNSGQPSPYLRPPSNEAKGFPGIVKPSEPGPNQVSLGLNQFQNSKPFDSSMNTKSNMNFEISTDKPVPNGAGGSQNNLFSPKNSGSLPKPGVNNPRLPFDPSKQAGGFPSNPASSLMQIYNKNVPKVSSKSSSDSDSPLPSSQKEQLNQKLAEVANPIQPLNPNQPAFTRGGEPDVPRKIPQIPQNNPGDIKEAIKPDQNIGKKAPFLPQQGINGSNYMLQNPNLPPPPIIKPEPSIHNSEIGASNPPPFRISGNPDPKLAPGFNQGSMNHVSEFIHQPPFKPSDVSNEMPNPQKFFMAGGPAGGIASSFPHKPQAVNPQTMNFNPQPNKLPFKEEIKKNEFNPDLSYKKEIAQSIIFPPKEVISPFPKNSSVFIAKRPSEGLQKLDKIIPKNDINIIIIKVNQETALKSQLEVINFLSRLIDYNKLIKEKDSLFQFLKEYSNRGSEECKKTLEFFKECLSCKICNEKNHEHLLELRCKTIICRPCLKNFAEQSIERKFFECPDCRKVIDEEEQWLIWNELKISPEQFQREKLENKLRTKKQLKCKKCERYKKNYWPWCLHLCKECFAGDLRKNIIPCNSCHLTVEYEKILNENFKCNSCEKVSFFVGSYGKFVNNESFQLCVQCVYDYFNQGINQKLNIRLNKGEKIEINDHLFLECAGCSIEFFRDYLEVNNCEYHLMCRSCKGNRPCRFCPN